MKSPGPSYTGTLVSSSKSSKDISMTRDGVADVRGRWNRAHRMATIASAVRRRISATSVPPGGTRRFKNTGTFGPPPSQNKKPETFGKCSHREERACRAGCQVGELSSSSGAGGGVGMASRPTVRSMRTMIVPSGGRHSARAFARSGRGGGDATGGPLRKTQKTLPNFQVVLERFVVQNLRRALTPQRCMVSPNLIHILILPELTSCFPANCAPFS